MMNSVNTLEFLKPKLITMDKFHNTTTTTRILPPPSTLAQTRTFVTIFNHTQQQQQQQQQQQNLITTDAVQQQQQQHLRQERVKVQHLENHTKLQNNNCWNNFRTLYQLSASSGDRELKRTRTIRDNTITTTAKDNEEEVDVEHFTTTTTNIQQNTSAFNLDINNKKKYYIYDNINESATATATNNNNNTITNTIVNNFHSQHYSGLINPFVWMAPQRTKDQDHAYRHIESVHNYAKLKSYEDDDDSPNGSRHSSFLDDDDDDDDGDDDDDDDDIDEEDEEDENDIVYDDDDDDRVNQVGTALANDLVADYELIFKRRRLQKSSTSTDDANHGKPLHLVEVFKQNPPSANDKVADDDDDDIDDVDDDDDLHIDVDVETVDTQQTSIALASASNPIAVNNQIIDSSPVKPDHHARRPMNAFLIFCKRHRAIVKERYKNLENRAITKILGDWWASLEADDKKCFTTLAQLNKDAFFSANPNFKWYKLPAPPLRTLTTRPANVTGQEYDDNEANTAAMAMETISNNTRSSITNTNINTNTNTNSNTNTNTNTNINSNTNSNYFKLADEAQMGDLSQLMQDKSKTSTKLCAALQQALGETSQFISAHITGNDEILPNKQLKRRLDNENNSVSSNSSEEDALQPTKKTARTCKGKRYQELINSGQIATAVKKSKSSLRLLVGGVSMDLEGVKQAGLTNLNNNNNNNNLICQKRSDLEAEHLMPFDDIASFDLEERIKDLPALNLDDYLQRKRNTKKKKKFSAAGGKKRGKHSGSGSTSQTAKHQPMVAATNDNTNMNVNVNMNRNIMQLQQQQQQKQAAAAAVGSQKRKARKESITRRDVSAIEQEVASLLPLTFNGCCYFQEGPPKAPALTYMKPLERDNITTPHLTTSPIIPLQNSSNDILNNNNNNNNLNDNISSSTSDLLILAEVAANRTELKH